MSKRKVFVAIMLTICAYLLTAWYLAERIQFMPDTTEPVLDSLVNLNDRFDYAAQDLASRLGLLGEFQFTEHVSLFYRCFDDQCENGTTRRMYIVFFVTSQINLPPFTTLSGASIEYAYTSNLNRLRSYIPSSGYFDPDEVENLPTNEYNNLVIQIDEAFQIALEYYSDHASEDCPVCNISFSWSYVTPEIWSVLLRSEDGSASSFEIDVVTGEIQVS